MPLITDHLCDTCKNHFSSVRRLLDELDIHYTIDGRLVRGLDYYTKTAFELSSTELGSQDALAGGGRYDLLTEELGGKATPGVGFAAGIERLLMVLEKRGYTFPPAPVPSLFIAAADSSARQWAYSTVMALRAAGIAAETDLLNRSLKAQMREADRQKAAYVLVVGANELSNGTAKLKRMDDSSEKIVQLNDLRKEFTSSSAI